MKKQLTRLLAGPLLLMGALGGLCQLAAQTPTTTPDTKKNKKVEAAEELFRSNKPSECFEKLVEAVKEDSTLPPARLMMARLYFSTKQGQQAGRMFLERALVEKESADHPECYLTNASIALAEGRLFETLVNCQTALGQADGARWNADQQKKFRTEARAGLATAYEARNDWANARTQLTQWSNLDPDNIQVRLKLARAHFLLGNNLSEKEAALHEKDARDELQAAIKRDKDKKLDPVEVTMGQFHTQMVGMVPLVDNPKNDPKIEDSNKEIMKKDDEHLKKAEECFLKAIKDEPSSVLALRAYAGWLLDRRLKDENGEFKAAALIDKAAKLEKEPSKETQALQGLLARYQKSYNTAIKIFEKILFEDRENFFAANQLALCLVEGDDKAKSRAAQTAETNVRFYSRAADAYATAGWVYFRMKRYEDADKHLGAAISNNQLSPDTAYYVAKLLAYQAEQKDATKEAKEKKETKERAISMLEKALASKGAFVNHDAAVDFLKELKGTPKPVENKKKVAP